MKRTQWIVYILRCADGTLYTGVTNDLEKRLAKHERGTGAKYTRGRGPFEVIFSQRLKDRGSAQKRESEIKSMDKKGKLALAKKRKKTKSS